MLKLGGLRRVVPVKVKLAADWVVWNATRRSSTFWDLHYRFRGTSGPGSRGQAATIKAHEVNRIVDANRIHSIVEFGCGDGYQLGMFSIPKYIGLDVSDQALRRCMSRYGSDPSKTFLKYDHRRWRDRPNAVRADLALSMDVIFHLVEDEVYEAYMSDLFAAADRFVLIYSTDGPIREHEPLFTRHRRFTDWVAGNAVEWELSERIDNPASTGADLYLFTRKGG